MSGDTLMIVFDLNFISAYNLEFLLSNCLSNIILSEFHNMSVALHWYRATLEIYEFTWGEIWYHKWYLILRFSKSVEICVIL